MSKKLFYFYAYDRLSRDYPAVSSPGSGFYSLTATQSALLGNRGVTSAKMNAALNYLDSLTGACPTDEPDGELRQVGLEAPGASPGERAV